MNTSTTHDAIKLTKLQLRRISRERFLKVRRAENGLRNQLIKLGQNIGSITHSFAEKGTSGATMVSLRRALEGYSRAVRPWAREVVEKMHQEVGLRDAKAWSELGKEMGIYLNREMRSADIQDALNELLDEQTELITNMPIEAVQRIHRFSIRAASGEMRPDEVAKEIMRQADVSKNKGRAMARDFVNTTQTTVTRTRAVRLGSEGYIWRTAGDEDVRPAISLPAKERVNYRGSHRKLEGTFHRWDDPPVSGQKGERAHPGCIYGCRCWPEPVLPDRIT